MRTSDIYFVGAVGLLALGGVAWGVMRGATPPGAAAIPQTDAVFGARTHAGVDALRPPGMPPGAWIDPETGRIVGVVPPSSDGAMGLSWTTLELPENFSDPEAVPDAIQALDGQSVAMLGFVMPLYQAFDFRDFILVASSFTCCYGAPPGLDGLVEAKLDENVPGLDMDARPHLVEGTFRVRPERIDPRNDESPILLVYRLENARARPLAED